MTHKPDVEAFVEDWLTRNMHGQARGSAVLEVDRLAAELTGDARAAGISGRALHQALGDIDDFLMVRYEQACAAQNSAI